MAIQSIIADIQASIQNWQSVRDNQYRHNRIRFIFSKEHVVNTVTHLILEAYINTPAARRFVGAPTRASVQHLQQYVERSFKKVFSVKNISDEHKSLGWQVFKTQKEAQAATPIPGSRLYPVAIYKTGHDVTAIYFASFYGPPNRVATQGDLQNVLVRNLMNQCIMTTIDDMTNYGTVFGVRPFGLGGRLPVVSRGTLLTHMPREGTYRRRVHGEPIGTRTGGSDTTVPSVNMIETIQKNRRAIITKAMIAGKLPMNIVDQLIDTIVQQSTVGLVVKRKSMSSVIQHESDIEIVITLANDLVNTYQNTRADKAPLDAAVNAVKASMLSNFTNPNYQASKSPRTRIPELAAKIAIDNVLPKSKGNVKVTKNTAAQRKGKTEKLNDNIRKAVGITTGTNKTISHKKASSKKFSGTRNTRGGKTGPSPIALRNIINKFLPQTLKSMMVAPRLVYRTGRFANSARVENIYQGSRGGYSADYTYMKNPYQTFEPGFNMGSTFRDPRSIISTAIRSIALEQMGIKFGQVRRT